MVLQPFCMTCFSGMQLSQCQANALFHLEILQSKIFFCFQSKAMCVCNYDVINSKTSSIRKVRGGLWVIFFLHECFCPPNGVWIFFPLALILFWSFCAALFFLLLAFSPPPDYHFSNGRPLIQQGSHMRLPYMFLFVCVQEAIAYFPLVALISGVLASLLVKSLNKKVGQKVRRT